MCMLDDDDRVTVLLECDRKARKAHKCDECRRTISPGETHEEQRFTCEGTIIVSKTCTHCQVPRSWLSVNCGGWVYGQVLEDIAEHVTEYPYLAEPLGKFRDGMRHKWSRDGSLLPIPDQAPRINVEDDPYREFR